MCAAIALGAPVPNTLLALCGWYHNATEDIRAAGNSLVAALKARMCGVTARREESLWGRLGMEEASAHARATCAHSPRSLFVSLLHSGSVHTCTRVHTHNLSLFCLSLQYRLAFHRAHTRTLHA